MKHRIKTFLSCLTILAIVICYIPYVCAEQEVLSTDPDVAEAYLVSSATKKGFAQIDCAGNTPVIGYKGGKSCWILDPKSTHTVYFKFTDSYKPVCEFDGTTYDVEIEYYDEYEGFFQLEYDRKGRNEIEYDRIAFMTKDRLWKTLKVSLDDAVFNRNYNGFDFAITIKATLPWGYYTDRNNENTVAIRHVKVIKHTAENPVYVTSKTDVSGNSYAWFWKEKNVTNIIENVSDTPQSVTVISKMVSEKQETPFTQSDTVSLEPGETKSITVDAGEVTSCGIYDWVVDVKRDDAIISEFKPIKVAVLKTDPNGIRDENIFFAFHSDRYQDSVVDNGFDVLSLTNAAGARVDIGWSSILDSDGNIDWNGTSVQRNVMKLNERGMKAYGLMWETPTKIGLFKYHELPKSDDQIAAWREYAQYIGKVIAPYLSHIEIWNEPNLKEFCWDVTYETGAEYAKMAIAAKEEIQKYAPDVKIAGPGVTGISQGPEWTAQYEKPTSIGGLHYIMQALEKDFQKYFSNVSVHAYAWGIPEASTNYQYLRKIKDMWAEKGENEPDIWITEAGFSRAATYVQTDYMQGALNVRQILHLKEEDALGGLYCIYNFERKGYQPYQNESGFGVVNPAYEELPMYGTYDFPTDAALMITAMNYVMANSKLISAEKINGQHVGRYKSEKWGKDIVTLYTEHSSDEYITLDLGCSEVTLYDIYGNEETICGNNGIFTFSITDSPIYLVGDISKAEIAENKALVKVATSKLLTTEGGSATLTAENLTDSDMSIEVEVPPCASAPDKTDFPSGSTKNIVIQNNAPFGTVYKTKIKFIGSKGIVQTQDVEVTVDKPVFIDFDCVLNDSSDINSWNGIFKVQNISTTEALKGKITFKGPDLVKDTGVDIGIIPRGKTGLVNFALPKLRKKGEYTFEYDLTTQKGEKYSFSKPFNLTIACYMDKKPVIDGILSQDEWIYDSAMYADEFGQIVNLETTDWEWQGPQDLSGKCGIGWDEDNMYMFCEVTDDIFCQKNSVSRNWDGDGIQFGIVYNEATGVAIGQMGTTFHEIGMALSPEGPGVYRYLSQDNVYDTGVVDKAEVAVRREGNKTYYELRLPWEALLLPGQRPHEGEKMGYSFLINEDDGSGRAGWIEYASGIGRNKNTSLFTILQLIK